MGTQLLTKPKVILFDLDGTLFDNSHIVVDAYESALQKFNFPSRSRDLIASLAGKSTFDTARGLDVPEDQLDKIDSHFWEFFGNYAADPKTKPKMFDHADRVIDFAIQNGITLGICTSNAAKNAELLLQKFNLDTKFSVFVGSEHPVEKKPSAEPITFALNQLNTQNEINNFDVWFIGDTKYDVLSARNFGAVSMAIPVPHTFEEVILSDPDYLFDTMQDLYNLLLSLYD